MEVSTEFLQRFLIDHAPDTYDDLSPGLKSSTTRESWLAYQAAEGMPVGEVLAFRPHALTWYQQDGIIAAVDYHGETVDGLVCGYVILSGIETDRPLVARVEKSYVSVEAQGAMALQDLAQYMTTARCPRELVQSTLDARAKRN